MGKMKELFMKERERESVNLSSDEDYIYEMYRLQREMEERIEKSKNKTNQNGYVDGSSRSISPND